MAKKPTTPEKDVYRDSKTGKWTKKANVARYPATTEKERRPVRNPNKPKGKGR